MVAVSVSVFFKTPKNKMAIVAFFQMTMIFLASRLSASIDEHFFSALIFISRYDHWGRF